MSGVVLSRVERVKVLISARQLKQRLSRRGDIYPDTGGDRGAAKYSGVASHAAQCNRRQNGALQPGERTVVRIWHCGQPGNRQLEKSDPRYFGRCGEWLASDVP